MFIAWMSDVLDILKGHGIGWALWNLRGSFGVVDSGRSDLATRTSTVIALTGDS